MLTKNNFKQSAISEVEDKTSIGRHLRRQEVNTVNSFCPQMQGNFGLEHFY